MVMLKETRENDALDRGDLRDRGDLIAADDTADRAAGNVELQADANFLVKCDAPP